MALPEGCVGVRVPGPSSAAYEAVISDFAAIVAAGAAAEALGRPRSRSIEHEMTIAPSRALVESGPSGALGPRGC